MEQRGHASLSPVLWSFREVGVFEFFAYVFQKISLPLGLTIVFYAAQEPRTYDESGNYKLKKCTCDCWDGKFKRPYGRGWYKSLYFSIESETGWLFLNVILFSSFGEKALWSFLKLAWEKKARITSSLILASTVVPLWYGSWMIFNYINDRFYNMFLSQLFFTVTELISAGLAYRFLDASRVVDESGPRPLLAVSCWIIITICIVHIIQSGADQMVNNVFYRKNAVQSSIGQRDLAFLLCDLIQMMTALYQVWALIRKQERPWTAFAKDKSDTDPHLDYAPIRPVKFVSSDSTSAYSLRSACVDAKSSALVSVATLILLQSWNYQKE